MIPSFVDIKNGYWSIPPLGLEEPTAINLLISGIQTIEVKYSTSLNRVLLVQVIASELVALKGTEVLLIPTIIYIPNWEDQAIEFNVLTAGIVILESILDESLDNATYPLSPMITNLLCSLTQIICLSSLLEVLPQTSQTRPSLELA